MSDLFGNPEDLFSHVAAYVVILICNSKTQRDYFQFIYDYLIVIFGL